MDNLVSCATTATPHVTQLRGPVGLTPGPPETCRDIIVQVCQQNPGPVHKATGGFVDLAVIVIISLNTLQLCLTSVCEENSSHHLRFSFRKNSIDNLRITVFARGKWGIK